MALGLVACSVLAILQMPEFGVRSLYRPLAGPQDAVTQAADVIDAGRRSRAIEREKASIRAQLAIPPAFLRLARGHTVDVVPVDTSAIWAYDLDWRPELLLQWYLAYDSKLDRLNAELLDQRGAERILRAGWGTVDGKVSAFEAPATYLTLLCHYRQIAADSRWQVFARASDRCGAPTLLRTVRAHAGDRLEIPPPPNRSSIVYAQIDFAPGVVERLESAVFKPLHLPSITLDGNDSRFIPAIAPSPLVLTLPASAGIAPNFGGGQSSRTLELHRVASPFTVRFFALPLGGSASP